MSVRLMDQYHRLIYAIWLGCRLEGEALQRFERLQTVYCARYARAPIRREVYAA